MKKYIIYLGVILLNSCLVPGAPKSILYKEVNSQNNECLNYENNKKLKYNCSLNIGSFPKIKTIGYSVELKNISDNKIELLNVNLSILNNKGITFGGKDFGKLTINANDSVLIKDVLQIKVSDWQWGRKLNRDKKLILKIISEKTCETISFEFDKYL